MTPSAVHLFAGPGGLEWGAKLPGVGIELDRNAVATRIAAGLPTIHGDVTRYGPADIPATVLTGGPPCQTFSVAGSGEGRMTLVHLQRRAKFMAARETVLPDSPLDGRSLLVLEPLRWILAAADSGRPYRAIILEQVPQVMPIWHAYADLLRAEGYSVATGVLNAEQYGLPQTRKRAVLVARLDGRAELPKPTHRKWVRNPAVVDADLLPTVTMGEALDRPGPFTVISNYGTGGDPKNRGRRSSDEPAFTVTGKISRNRIVDGAGRELPRLTAAEAGVLQGFPPDWPWSGGDIAQQVGNACPIPLAAALARAASAA